jgi:transcriptional regulator with XRE-family HTH domain
MGSNVYSIRKKLNLSLTDMADFLGATKSWVYKVETTRASLSADHKDKVRIISAALLKSKKVSGANAWLKHNEQCKRAEKWLANMRSTAEVKAATMTYELDDMRKEYARHLLSLNRFAAILKDPECTKEIADWAKWKAAIIAQKAERVGPMEQAKLILKRDEVLGRQFGDEIVANDLFEMDDDAKKS